MKNFFSKKVLGCIALAVVCVMLGTVIGSSQPTAQADEVVLTSPFTEAVAKVHDSVVGVNNYQIMNNNSYGNYGNYGDFGGFGYGFPFGYFGFGDGGYGGYGYGGNGNGNGRGSQGTAKEVQYASGSGVVIAENYVLTNHHVVEGASSLKVSVVGDQGGDPTLYEATVVADDADLDVAVLYVPGLNLAPVTLGDSDALQLGDWAICIGNPLGFTGTVTAGIISGLDREIEGDGTTTDKYGRTTNVVNKMIQTDAAINSGISGGGMFNTAGELVGIPTLKYSGSRYTNSAAIENVGMCIPINEAKAVIDEALKADVSGIQEKAPQTAGDDQLESGNDLKGKPRMGVTVTTLNGAASGGTLPNGAYVISVEEGTPADKAGVKAGDIIVEVEGQVISSVTEMMNLLSSKQEGDQVAVKVFRPATVEDAENGRISTDGEYVDLTVTLAIVDAVNQ